MLIEVGRNGILVKCEKILNAREAWNLHRTLVSAIHEYHDLVGQDQFRAEMELDPEDRMGNHG